VPCAFMHAVVPPASSHARLTLDWLAISRALPLHHRRCVFASYDMSLEIGRVATKTSSSNRRNHERNFFDADMRSAIDADEASIPKSLFLVFAFGFRHV
jgi:hypothetical protein